MCILDINLFAAQSLGSLTITLIGQRSACGHVVVCLVHFRVTKAGNDTNFHPIDLPLWGGLRGDKVSGDAMFYGLMVVCLTSA